MTVRRTLKTIVNLMRPKSPCCNEPMKNIDSHTPDGNAPIYECSKCKEEYI